VALIDGEFGAAIVPGGRARAVFVFVVEGGRIVEIGLVTDAGRLGQFELALLDD
jgi:hypothetical protein